jgi:hypothetical protein
MEKIWEEITEILRLLRGDNLWRGREFYLMATNELRLQMESRGDLVTNEVIYVHILENINDIWAEKGVQKWYCKDFQGDLKLFLAQLTHFAKGEKKYMHTSKDFVEYR